MRIALLLTLLVCLAAFRLEAQSSTDQSSGNIFQKGGALSPDEQVRQYPELRVIQVHVPVSDPIAVVKRAMSADEYNLTPGDFYRLSVQIADLNNTYDMVLSKDFSLELPYLGTLNVRGMIFTNVREAIIGQIKKVLPRASFVDFTLQSTGQFDVQVFGEVQSPGDITVDSLSRVSDVIGLANGVLVGGSIRRIQLARAGHTRVLDLFAYAQFGNADQDPYVEPGDRICVPRAQCTVALVGAVEYPGYYELVPGETISALLDYAGGPLSNANLSGTEIFHPHGGDNADGPAAALSDGDQVRVPFTNL